MGNVRHWTEKQIIQIRKYLIRNYDIRKLEIKQGITLDKIAEIIEDELDPDVYTRFL